LRFPRRRLALRVGVFPKRRLKPPKTPRIKTPSIKTPRFRRRRRRSSKLSPRSKRLLCRLAKMRHTKTPRMERLPRSSTIATHAGCVGGCPITVRRADDHFELIAGERRLRAATRLGWADIPAIVKDYDDKALLTLALVENLQRADLNPIEEAEGYSRLVAEFDLTQQEVAAIVGKDRSTVANSLRLLNLPAPIREMVQASRLSVGHARALLAIPSERVMIDLAREAVAKNLSVRDIERRVKQATTSARPPSTTSAKTDTARLAEIRRVTDRLRRRLQTDVTVDIDDKDRGQLRITFYSADDLNRLIELITGHTTEDL